ncbi:hypothetical protein BMS3Abin05_00124 [bacterium BMS3Abin05]|nr:hypothetical protein BMS3Abin05_00124 [bacterium BMS3Abin05]
MIAVKPKTIRNASFVREVLLCFLKRFIVMDKV